MNMSKNSDNSISLILKCLFMRKISLFLLSIVVLFFVSCNADILQDLESSYVEENRIASLQSTWQEQVEYAKSQNVATRSAFDEVTLIKYTYKGKINTQKQISELLNCLFSDDADVVTYLDSVNYDIVPLKTIREKAKQMNIDDPSESLRLQLDSVIELGMEVIDLEWSYKGRTVYSTAIASNERGGIIYDHIGHMIATPSNQYVEIEPNVELMKTRSEGTDGDREIITDLSNYGTNKYNKVVWEYRVYCSSTFDGNGILQNRNLFATSDAKEGWACNAQIRTVSGELGVSNYHEFAWAHAHGENITISIGWNGTGFTISSGATGASYTLIHRR